MKAWEEAGLPMAAVPGKNGKAAVTPERKPSPGGTQKKKYVNLALQGGGTHGAFTWGVLDRLLEDDRINIEAISGTSAGAMNAVLIADGLMTDGKEGARRAMDGFWRSVSHAAQFSPMKRTALDVLTGNWNLDRSPSYIFFELMEKLASPYVFNPFNLNPLRELLARQVDFERVRRCDILKVFVSATNVRTGCVKLFDRKALTVDMVMASASLPYLFQAVEIAGDYYWDGGYAGNPVLYPFAYQCTSKDVVLVQINPMYREEVPMTAQEILNRVNEITFNGSLMKELRAIEFIGRLLDSESVDPSRYKKMLIHVVQAQDELKQFNASSKFNAEWGFLTHLRALGRATAAKWLDENFAAIGERSSVDLRSLFE